MKSISNMECQRKSKDYIDESHLCTLCPVNQGMCDVSYTFEIHFTYEYKHIDQF